MEKIRQEITWILAIGAAIAGLYFLGPVLPPFVMAFIIAYLGNPLVTWLMKWSISRFWSACIVFLFFVWLLVLAFILLVPMLQHQILLFFNKLPDILGWMQQTLLPRINDYFGVEEALPVDYLKKAVSENFQQTGTVAVSVWKTLSHSGVVILDSLLTCLLVPVVTFYLLRDWPKVWATLLSYLPKSVRPKIAHFMRESDDVLGAFLRGQLIVILCLGVIYSVGLWLAGMEFALLIGLISGLINIVPYLGMIVGMTTACIMMYMQYHDGLHVLYAIAVFLIGSGLDNTVLTPNLIGDKIGLHPIAVIFSVLAGGHLFGAVGVLLALPAAAIIMVFLRHLRTYFTHAHA